MMYFTGCALLCFRSKRSTNHAIIELVDKITKVVENNEFTVGVTKNYCVTWNIRVFMLICSRSFVHI